MRAGLRKSFGAIILVLLLVVTVAADLRIKVRTSYEDNNFPDRIIYLKGLRQRTEMVGPNGAVMMAMIYQCDLRKELVVHPNLKSYTLQSFDEIRQNLARFDEERKQKARAPRPGKGGAIKYTYTAADTGERREMFGFTARRIKSSIQVEPSKGACHQYGYRIEMDGWYADLLYDLECTANLSGARLYPDAFNGQEFLDLPFRSGSNLNKLRGGCRAEDDWSDYRRLVTARLGFPLRITATIYDESVSGPPLVVTKQVVELSQDELDTSLFSVPAGYTQMPVQYVSK